MIVRQSSRIFGLSTLLGCGLILGLTPPLSARQRGDGQTSTSISEPIGQGRGAGSINTRPFGSQPVGEDQISIFPEGRAGVPESRSADDDLNTDRVDQESVLAPGGGGQPPGVSDPRFPFELPSALDPRPDVDNLDLAPGRVRNLEDYESQLLPAARAITDPAERALALDRVARSKIRSRLYSEADEALAEATRAAGMMPPGLRRDLRLITISRTYLTLAHDRVVEAVPTISPVSDVLTPRQDASRSGDWLELALEEFARAAAVVEMVGNSNYRSEHLASIIEAQAIDSMKINNDASRAYTTNRYIAEQAPELLAFSDRLLVQATRQAATLDRAIWQDQSMVVLTITAARSNQFARAYSIARGISRADARSEALVQVAEEMARVGALFRVQYSESLARSWKDLENGIQAGAALEPTADGQFSDFGITTARANVLEDVLYRIEGHSQTARALRMIANELLLKLQQNETVRTDVRSPLGDTPTLIAAVSSLGTAAEALEDALANLRVELANRRDATRSLDYAAQSEALANAVPRTNDPLVAHVRQENERVARILTNLSRPLDEAATPTYMQAAAAVGSIVDLDPRANAAYSLVDSLKSVGRFTDARIATQLIPSESRRYVALAEIAESQGRRGMPEEARAWIAREIPPDRQSLLNRAVEQGVLDSLAQLRSRSNGGLGGATGFTP